MAKYFLPVDMKSKYDGGYLKSGIVKNGVDFPDVPNGGFYACSFEKADNTVYGKDKSTLLFKDPVATDKPFVVDIAEVPTIIDDKGNEYRIGNDTTSLTAKGGQVLRFREVAYADTFELGDDNFDATPVVGEYATLGTTSQLVPANAMPATGFAVKIMDEKSLIAGLTPVGKRYECIVVQL